MCTVTFIPTETGCLITSNRDEIFTRSKALAPQVYDIEGHDILFPKDPKGGGSWIATGEDISVCLLNGGFEPHERKPSYRHSRGLIPLTIIQLGGVEAFVKAFDFEGIEPFTVIIFTPKGLWQVVWDELKPHVIEHDPAETQIWASAPLYTPEVRTERRKWFSEWLNNTPERTQENILAFHTQESQDKVNGLLIDRLNGLRTVSVTSIIHELGQGAEMQYRDLSESDYHQSKLNFHE